MKAKPDKLNPNLMRARRRGQVAIEPSSREIFLDLDSPRALRRYGLQFAILHREGLTKGWRERIMPSKKKNHAHVVISLPRARSIMEREWLSLVLGSDQTRGAFNYCRIKKRHKYPIVLFRPGKKK